MKILVIVNGSAYGQETSFNALRLAGSLAKREGEEVTVFLLGDGVTSAIANQKTPDGYYKLDRMLTAITLHHGVIECCGTCMDARGITDAMLVEGARRSTMEELTTATLAADKVLVF